MSQFLEQFQMAGCDAKGVMDRFMDDEELLRECLEQFVAENDFTGLEDAISKADYQTAFEYAHALKGIVGNLGITPVYQPVCVLVEALRTSRTENAPAQLCDVMKAYERFVEQYKKMR